MKPTLVVDHTQDSFLLHWLVLEKECPLDVVNQRRFLADPVMVKAPYFTDGEVVVYDHEALVQFLQERYPGISLMPADPLLRAQVRQACKMVRDADVDIFAELNVILHAGSQFTLGAEFSMLDIYIGTWLADYVLTHKVTGVVRDYWKRISVREAFRIAAHGTG